MPNYGVDRIIRGNPIAGDPPGGWATLILGAGASVDKIDLLVTGYSDVKHELMSQIGTEQVEDGSQITDHVVAMPTKLSLVGHVSDISMGPDAAGDAWEEIRKLHREKAIMKVITEWGIYDEMVIKSADTMQNTRGMEFSLTLQHIVRVGVGRSTLVPVAAPATGRGANVDTGTKNLTETVAVTPLGGDRFLARRDDGSEVILKPTRDENGTIVKDSQDRIIWLELPPAE